MRLAQLRALCRPGAEVRFVFEPHSEPRALEPLYREVGLAVSGREVPAAEARALPTTWARKLGFSGKRRTLWELRGRVVPA